jgi:hypothetical protein
MNIIKIKKLSFLKTILFLTLILSATVSQAQQIEVKGTVKGKINNEVTPLDNATIYLKGTKTATTTTKKGAFKFPKKLNIGDVLVFSYLGYLKKSIKIKENTTTLNVVLLEDENEMLGALNSNKRYASKRKKQKN